MKSKILILILCIFVVFFSTASFADPSISILSIQFTAGTSDSPTDKFDASNISNISVVIEYNASGMLPKDLVVIGVEARNSKGTLIANNSATIRNANGNERHIFKDLVRLNQFSADDKIKVLVTMMVGTQTKRMEAQFIVEGRSEPDTRIHKIVCLPLNGDEILRGQLFNVGMVYEIRDTLAGDKAVLRIATLVDDPNLLIEDFHLRAPFWEETTIPAGPGWYNLNITVRAPNFFEQYNSIVHKLYVYCLIDFSESHMKGREKTDRQFFANANYDLIDEFPGEPHYSSNLIYKYPEIDRPAGWKLSLIDRDKAWEIMDKYEDDIRSLRRRGRFDRR